MLRTDGGVVASGVHFSYIHERRVAEDGRPCGGLTRHTTNSSFNSQMMSPRTSSSLILQEDEFGHGAALWVLLCISQ